MIDADRTQGTALGPRRRGGLGRCRGACRPGSLPSDFDQTAPAINGVNVVWEDSRNAETAGTDVYMYNTGTSTESLVAGGNGEQDQPAISDRYIVWIDDGRLRAKNRSSGRCSTSPTGPPPRPTRRSAARSSSGATRATTRTSTPSDLAGGSEIAVATSRRWRPTRPATPAGSSTCARLPRVGEHPPLRHRQPARPRSSPTSPGTSGGPRSPVTGSSGRPGRTSPTRPRASRSWARDLSTGQDFVVSDGPGNQTAPVISGSMVAWEDVRDGDSRIWWRDLAATKGEQPVTTEDVIGAPAGAGAVQQGARLPEQPHRGVERLPDTAAQPVIRPSVAVCDDRS